MVNIYLISYKDVSLTEGRIVLTTNGSKKLDYYVEKNM